MELQLKEVLESIDIENVENYVRRCCAETNNDNTAKYQMQINNALTNLEKCIDDIKNGNGDMNLLWGYISHYGKVYRDIYFELGVCTGVKIGYELNR